MIYEEFLTIENIKSVFHKLEFTHDFKTLIPAQCHSDQSPLKIILSRKIDNFLRKHKWQTISSGLCGHYRFVILSNKTMDNTFFKISLYSKPTTPKHNLNVTSGEKWDNQMQDTQTPLHLIIHIIPVSTVVWTAVMDCHDTGDGKWRSVSDIFINGQLDLDQWKNSYVRHRPIGRQEYMLRHTDHIWYHPDTATSLNKQ